MGKLPLRLENAITKLYTAFHEGKLNALDCRACAVGNICNNIGGWSQGGLNNRQFKNQHLEIAMYSSKELSIVETLFMYGVKNIWKEKEIWYASDNTKETQFKGLCAVVEYLCELDNIPNVMDYTKLFETENDKPKYALV